MKKENIVALAEVCEVLQGKNVDRKKCNDNGEGLPVVVGASDLVQGAFIPKRWCSETLKEPTLSEAGDILLSVVGTLGKMASIHKVRRYCQSTFAPCAPGKVSLANISWL